MWIVFQQIHSTVLHHLRLAESAGAEPWIPRATCKVRYVDFHCTVGSGVGGVVGTLNPCIVQVSTVQVKRAFTYLKNSFISI